MNYYERHIGDYLKDTSHLSLLEHGIYTRLMDVYYTREGAIPASDVARLIGARTKEEKAALDVVLGEFFVLQDGAYLQARCEREIERYKEKQNKARSSANARWKNDLQHTERNANAMRTHSGRIADAVPTQCEGNAPNHQTPVTSNSVSKDTGDKSPLSPEQIIFGYGLPLLTNAGTAEKQARSFLGGLRKAHGDDALINALRDCLKEKPLQPLEWLAAVLPPSQRANKQEKLEAQNRAVVKRLLDKEQAHESVG